MASILGWMASPGFQVWQLSCSSVETEAAGRRGAGIVHDILSARAGNVRRLSISMESLLPFHFRPL